MTDFERLLKNLEKLIEETQDKLTDREDELRDEVIDNVREILDIMDGDSDLMEYINDNFGVEIHEMDEYEFNNFCEDNCISYYDALDLGLSSGDTYFGTDSHGDYVSHDSLEDFVDFDDVAKEIVNDDVDFGNDDLREELDRLKEDNEAKEDFIKEVKKLLGIEEEVKNDKNVKTVNTDISYAVKTFDTTYWFENEIDAIRFAKTCREELANHSNTSSMQEKNQDEQEEVKQEVNEATNI